MKQLGGMTLKLKISLIIIVLLLSVGAIILFRPKDDSSSDVEITMPSQDEIEKGPTVPAYSYILADIQAMPASSILTESMLTYELIDQLFYSTEITEDIKERIWNVSYQENEYITLEDLRYLRVLYRDGKGLVHIGELIVNQKITDDILEIMKELFLNDYPIESMVLVDEYHADDDASMSANNSSAFNFRMVAGTDHLSNHSYGMAIDINPRYNPYIVTRNGETIITPENGIQYADRDADFPYKINENDLCVKLFLEHGFTWGGSWINSKDYQHFQKED